MEIKSQPAATASLGPSEAEKGYVADTSVLDMETSVGQHEEGGVHRGFVPLYEFHLEVMELTVDIQTQVPTYPVHGPRRHHWYRSLSGHWICLDSRRSPVTVARIQHDGHVLVRNGEYVSDSD